MKFIVGYQFFEDTRFLDLILLNSSRISEVYFPWDDLPNGRGTFSCDERFLPFQMQNRLIADLKRLSEKGISLNLLLNGNCYGRFSQSRILFERIGDIIDYLKFETLLKSVTTSSPLFAKFIKENFPSLEVRASVNISIGTVEAMDYLADWFDGYCLQREKNRDLATCRHLADWCEANGKRLYILANSGCLNNCSAHTFHDNLVSHEQEIRAMDNAYEFRGACYDYLVKPEKRAAFLCISNFVRPEDVGLYEGIVPAVKLATRTNRNPVAVLEAYLRGEYTGNLFDLLEPNHAESFYPFIIENARIPEDFAETLSGCSRRCDECNYCRSVLQDALVNLEEKVTDLC